MATERFAGSIALGGTIDERGIHIEPAFATTARPETPTCDGPLRLTVDVVADQTILSRAQVVADLDCYFRGQTGVHSFLTVVTLAAEATGVVVHSPLLNSREIARAPVDPSVQLLWQPKNPITGRQQVAWQAWHPQPQQQLRAVIEYTVDEGQTWRRLTCPTALSSATIDMDELPAGELRLSVLVTDGLNNARAVSAPFTLTRTTCKAVIVQPVDGARFAADRPIVAYGVGWSPGGDAVADHLLSWEDGNRQVIGHGSMVTLTLKPGKHLLRLVAGDQKDRGEADVGIIVE